MKTLKSLTAAFLIIISFNVMADDSTGTNATASAKKTIAAPAFNWGSPADANTPTVEVLKYLPVVAPEMTWGSAEDLNDADLEVLKVRAEVTLTQPAFSWGSAQDLDLKSLEILKTNAHTIRLPEMVIGNPEGIDASDLK